MPEMMSFEYLLRSSVTTSDATRREIRGASEYVPRAIDAVLKLPYFVARTPTADTSGFRWWAHGAYASAGHTAGALFLLWQQGFYLEATILLRHLLETLVQLRYFAARRDELMPHLTRTREVNFKKMFNVCAPGFYPFYSMWSGAAHGGIATSILRVGLSPVQASTWKPGCEYDESRASIVANQLVATLLGFTNLFPKLFPDEVPPPGASEDVLSRRTEAFAWLVSAVRAQLKQFPKSESWLVPLLKLADYELPST